MDVQRNRGRSGIKAGEEARTLSAEARNRAGAPDVDCFDEPTQARFA